ncbi:MAG: ATP-binding protein, partial [Oscillospiraceae bacterium]|nr:ATP-binding protein [Oscillospiraceae bacterium]
MTATKISEHSDRVVSIANDRLLRVAAIYGANASGKSNVFAAFYFMSIYILESFAFGGGGSKEKRRQIQAKPFKFDKDSPTKNTSFEVFFIDQTDSSLKSYQYGFSLKGAVIAEEWLYYKSKSSREYKTVFYRDAAAGKLDFDKISKIQAENITSALEPETLIVSLGAKLKI